MTGSRGGQVGTMALSSSARAAFSPIPGGERAGVRGLGGGRPVADAEPLLPTLSLPGRGKWNARAGMGMSFGKQAIRPYRPGIVPARRNTPVIHRPVLFAALSMLAARRRRSAARRGAQPRGAGAGRDQRGARRSAGLCREAPSVSRLFRGQCRAPARQRRRASHPRGHRPGRRGDRRARPAAAAAAAPGGARSGRVGARARRRTRRWSEAPAMPRPTAPTPRSGSRSTRAPA